MQRLPSLRGSFPFRCCKAAVASHNNSQFGASLLSSSSRISQDVLLRRFSFRRKQNGPNPNPAEIISAMFPITEANLRNSLAPYLTHFMHILEYNSKVLRLPLEFDIENRRISWAESNNSNNNADSTSERKEEPKRDSKEKTEGKDTKAEPKDTKDTKDTDKSKKDEAKPKDAKKPAAGATSSSASSKEKPKKKERKDDGEDGEDGEGDQKKKPDWFMYGMLLFGGAFGAVLTMAYFRNFRPPELETSWQSFRENLLDNKVVEQLTVVNDEFVDVYTVDAPKRLRCWFSVANAHDFEERLQQAYRERGIPPSQWINVRFVRTMDSEDLLRYLPTMLYIGVVLAIIRSMSKVRSMNNMKGGPWSLGKMGSLEPTKPSTKFKDVAGMDEAKQEIMEFVSYLKDSERFTRLGAKVPNGAILMGPPGTGKTLLAKAVAGETDVPFYSACGSDFIEMYVGVGPARVRSLFKEARKAKRAIIYIDEIDAIGRPRGRGIMSGANDERENTLNALLVEMDGFTKEAGQVIVLASTNVALDQLDSALVRPGRFDRQIHISRPEIKERISIFKLHLSALKLQNREEMLKSEKEREEKLRSGRGGGVIGDVDVLYDGKPYKDPSEEELKATMPANVETTNDLLVLHRFADRMAHLTPGFVGADIANVCNEGALIAARQKSDVISLDHLEAAVDRVIAGIERRSRVLSPFEKKVVAYHEAGHAIVGWFLKYCDPLMKISIIPRGVGALGYTQYLPRERRINTAEQLADQICVLLGGRVAELINFGHLSTGARDDLSKVTQLAYTQISQFGMYPGGGYVSYPSPESASARGSPLKPYADDLAEIFDREAKKMVDAAFQRTRTLLEEKKKELELVAEFLLKHEVITRDDLSKLIGPRPFQDAYESHPDDETVPPSAPTPPTTNP